MILAYRKWTRNIPMDKKEEFEIPNIIFIMYILTICESGVVLFETGLE